MKLRDDVRLAAYAVSIGFELRAENGSALGSATFNYDGTPADTIWFVIGDVHVWLTAGGWRVSRLVDDVFEKPGLFFPTLKRALDEGAHNWRDR